jgi:hypothetical protein
VTDTDGAVTTDDAPPPSADPLASAPAAPDPSPSSGSGSSGSSEPGTDGEPVRPGPTVNSLFQGPVIAQKLIYGTVYEGEGQQRRERTTTGLIGSGDVNTALSHVVRPDCFVTAAERLRDRHSVVLEGAPGSGRYTGALALLREVTDGDVHRLDPTLTLKDLSCVDYERGRAYLVLDHVAPIDADEADYAWSAARKRVTEASAYLVVTRTRIGARIDQVAWGRPDAAAVMAGRLRSPGGCASSGAESTGPEPTDPELLDQESIDDLIELVCARLPEDWTLSGLIECANRLRRNGGDVQAALEAFDLSARREVADWFERDHSREEIVDIATLAFVRGTSERRFEHLTRRLKVFLELRVPVPEPLEGKERLEPTLPLGRRKRTGPLVKRVLDAGPVPRRSLDFVSEQHWLAVLGELQELLEAPFWEAVRDWIIDLLRNDVHDAEFAAVVHALAALARWDAEEAVHVLDVLAEDVAGDLGRGCAVAVVGLMSTDKALAPLALMIATRWLNARSRWHRVCAGAAFIGDLGITYPTEGSRRLWQLITQDHELSAEALSTPAWLFGGLVESGADATPVLDMVAEKLRKHAPPKAEPRMVELSLTMALWLLFIAHAKTKRCRALEYMVSHPQDSAQVAGIWAAVLCNRRSRLLAFDALYEAMRHSPDLATEGTLLAEALAQALPAGEHEAFVRDLRTVEARRRRKPDGPTESLAEVIISALRQRSRSPQTVGAAR